MTSVRSEGFGRCSQKSVKYGNSSPRSVPVSSASPRGGKAVTLIAAEGAEVGGPQEGDDFVLVGRCVQREVHAEAGEACLGRQVADARVLAEIEHRGAVENRAHARLADLEQIHAPVEVEAAMEHLQLEHRLAAPDGIRRAIADVTVLVVTEFPDVVRQLRPVVRIGLRGTLARDLVDVGKGEQRRRRNLLSIGRPACGVGQECSDDDGERLNQTAQRHSALPKRDEAENDIRQETCPDTYTRPTRRTRYVETAGGRDKVRETRSSLAHALL